MDLKEAMRECLQKGTRTNTEFLRVPFLTVPNKSVRRGTKQKRFA